MEEKRSTKVKFLGIWALALIGFAATDSLRNLPTMAVYGWSSIFWYLCGTILFLIPISLAAAEMATMLPVDGGVYTWIRKAFGEKAGFLGVWCEWSENIVWFPTVLSFIASSLAYAINPSLASNNVYLVCVMLTVFWTVTFLNFYGIKFSSFLSSFGSTTGTMIPQVILFTLAIWYLLSGHPIQIPFSKEALLPTLDLTSLPLLATMIMMFAGMGVVGYHAREVKNPSHDYPRGILISCFLVFALSILGTLAIASVVPVDSLNLAAGLMQAFEDFLATFGLQQWLTVIALLTTIGAIATLSTWMYGPSKGMVEVSKRGSLPHVFQKENKYGSPVNTLVISSISGTVFILMFLFIPSINASYWMMSALTTQILTIMYILCFASVIKLRYSQKDLARPFKVPGGKVGIWLVGGAGIVSCLFAFGIGFVPPTGVPVDKYWQYILFMIIGFIVLSCPPFIFMLFKKESWKKKE